MKEYDSEITGHLDIFVADNGDDSEGDFVKWRDVMIHGDPEGLKSFANPSVRRVKRQRLYGFNNEQESLTPDKEITSLSHHHHYS